MFHILLFHQEFKRVCHHLTKEQVADALNKNKLKHKLIGIKWNQLISKIGCFESEYLNRLSTCLYALPVVNWKFFHALPDSVNPVAYYTVKKHFKLFTDMLLPPKYRNGSHKQMKKKRYKISIHWFSSRLMLFSRHLTPLGTRRYAVKASFFLLNLIWMIYPSCLCVIIILTVELQRVLQLDEQ